MEAGYNNFQEAGRAGEVVLRNNSERHSADNVLKGNEILYVCIHL